MIDMAMLSETQTRGDLARLLHTAVELSGRNRCEIARDTHIHKDALRRTLAGERSPSVGEALRILASAGMAPHAQLLLFLGAGGDLTTRWLQTDIAHFFEELIGELPGALERVVEIAESLRVHITDMDRRFRALASSHPVCSVLMTVPGVGPITALSFFSAIGDPFRFDRNRDVGPYLGLTPSVHQSGVLSRPGRISWFGNKMTRTHLVTAATVLLCKTKQPSALQTWGLELSRMPLRPK